MVLRTRRRGGARRWGAGRAQDTHSPASLSGSFSVADLGRKKPCDLCVLPVLIPTKDKNLPND